MAPAALKVSLFVALLCMALTPAAAEATHQIGWQDENAGLPASVDLEEVATSWPNGSVMAVGHDEATGEAAIYARGVGTGGAWQQDQIAGVPAGASDARLVDVAFDVSCCDTAAFAVGTYVDSSGVTQPLVLQAEGASGIGLDQVAWAPPERGALPPGSEPTAVALHGVHGLIGTSAGEVYTFSDPADEIEETPVPPPPGAPPGPINAIAHYAESEAFTAGDLPPDDPGDPADGGTDRIYSIDLDATGGPQMLKVVASPADPDLDLVGISGESATDVVAVEEADGASDPGLWSPTSGIWSRATDPRFTDDSAPHDISVEERDGSVTRAVAGAHQGAGAVWRRSGAGAWARDESLSSEPLNGVSVAGPTDIWAVGEKGTAVRFAPLPDPPNTQIDSGPIGETTSTTATFTFSSSEAGAAFECSLDGAAFSACSSPHAYSGLALGSHTFRVRAVGVAGPDPTPDSRTFSVVSPTRTGSQGSSGSASTIPVTTRQPPPRCRQVPRPLLRNVVVKKRRGRLLIRFYAAAPTRVKAKAFHRRKLIGKTKMRVLGEGRHRLKLRYKRKRGKPTRLKMIARPAADDAC